MHILLKNRLRFLALTHLLPPLRAVLAAVVVLLSIQPAHAQSFQGLGHLPGGPFNSIAYAVSGDGLVVVGMGGNAANRPEAARWQGGVAQGLGYFDPIGPGHLNTPASYAVGISDGGTVIVGHSYYVNSQTTSLRQQAVRWAGGSPIEGLGFLPGGAISEASSVSADGTVIVGWSHTGSAIEAFRWENGQMQGLGHLNPSFPTSYARGISANGQVVVGTSGYQGAWFQAYRWENGQMQGLGFLLPEHTNSFAQAVSADGRVIVGNSNSRAFRWENGQMDGLGLPTTCNSSAMGVSDDGTVVVGTSQCPEIQGAFVWTASTGARSVKAVLESHGLDLTGWFLTSGQDISADGRVIVGGGTGPNGPEAWRAVLAQGNEGIVVTVSGDEPNHPDSATFDECDVDRSEDGLQCTLRAAIELANNRGGATITFNIEGDPFIILNTDRGDLPIIEHPTTLDGTIQEGGFVLVSSHGATTFQNIDGGSRVGLRLGPGAGGSTIRGIVVNGFGAAGIRIEPGADGTTIEGNRIGTDYSGTVAIGGGGASCRIVPMVPGMVTCLDAIYGAGLHVLSSNNFIADNVIAGNSHSTHYGSSELYWGSVQVLLDVSAHGNVLERNLIGYDADGNLLLTPVGETLTYEDWIACESVATCWAPVGVNVFGNGNTIGGSPEAANRIGGHWVDVWIRGESEIAGPAGTVPDARDNVVSHNRIGTDEPVLVTTTGGFDGGLTLLGLNNRAHHNTLTVTRAALTVQGPNEAYENTVTGWMEPVAPLDLHSRGQDTRGAIVAGGNLPVVRDNTVVSGAWGIVLSGEGHEATVLRNVVEGAHGALLMPTLNLPLGGAPTRFEGSVIEGNTFRAPDYTAYGLAFADGQQIRVADNTIETGGVGIVLPVNPFIQEFQNVLLTRNAVSARIGIDLGGDGVTPNDVSDLDQGPNGLLNFPVPLQVRRSGRFFEVEGVLWGVFSGQYTVEAFASATCSEARHYGFPYGPGEHYLGSVTVMPGITDIGEPAFSLVEGELEEEHRFITLTASREALGMTSEFSRCVPFTDAAQTARTEVDPEETGLVLNTQGVTVTVTQAAASGRVASAGTRQSGAGMGTLYLTRYEVAPDTSVFSDATATAPDGSEIHPTAVAPAYWWLADRHLTEEGGAEASERRFTVCLAHEGRVLEGWVDRVVLVQRSLATEGLWRPLDTELEGSGADERLCARNLATLGEFTFGAEENVFTHTEPDEPDEPRVPNSFTLSAVYPNPIMHRATVAFETAYDADVQIELFDLLGRRAGLLVSETLPAGRHRVEMDGSHLASGVYIIRMQAGRFSDTRRITILR